MGKKERHAMIIELIKQSELETQEALQEALSAHGFFLTQATISRDIRELQLVKQHLDTGGGYYRLPEQTPISDGILKDAVLQTDSAENIAVIRCRAGMAQAVCAAIDAMQNHQIVGTLAGDDTIFVLFRSKEQASTFAEMYTVWVQNGKGGDMGC